MAQHGEEGRFKTIIASLELGKLKGIHVFNGKDEKWCAPEELLLLTSIQYYGYGSWIMASEILSEYCNKAFTAEEVEKHYNAIYMQGILRNALLDAHVPAFPTPLVDHTSSEDEESLRSIDAHAYKNVPEEFLKEIGYYPLREDFELEYDENAEALLYKMNFADATEDYDKNVKIVTVDEYRKRVKERMLKKKYVKHLRLVERYYASLNPSYEKKVPENETLTLSPAACASIFSNYKSEEEHTISVTNKDYWNALLYYAHYHQSEGNLVLGVDSDFEELFSAVKDTDKKSSVNAKKDFNSFSKTLRKRRKWPENRDKKRRKELVSFSAREDLVCIDTENTRYLYDSDSSNPDSIDGPLIEDYPWAEYLSEEEKELCVELQMRPMYYIYYKSFLKQIDHLKLKGENPKANMIPASTTVAECARIVDFLTKSGWLQSSNLLNLAEN